MYFKKNRRCNNPSLNDIFKVLLYCRNESPNEYGLLEKQLLQADKYKKGEITKEEFDH